MTPVGIQVLVALLLVFCVGHAWIAVGPRLTAAFLAIAVVISWTLEELGIATGLVFGGYHYTAALGPTLGAVPILIPLAWFALAYPTSVLVGLVFGRWGRGLPRGRLGSPVGMAAICALAMAAWDVALDPILSGPAYRAWVWEGSGPAGAVPVQNYLGWAATSFAIFLAFGLLERRARPQRGEHHGRGDAARSGGPAGDAVILTSPRRS
jgi:uncharacterized membrane protein